MIRVTVFRNKKTCTGFRVTGHAGYAEEGYDIICSAVSALTINCVNSIEKLAGDTVEAEEESGFLQCRFPDGLSCEGRILMDSMLLGLNMIGETQDEAGRPYLVVDEEVS